MTALDVLATLDAGGAAVTGGADVRGAAVVELVPRLCVGGAVGLTRACAYAIERAMEGAPDTTVRAGVAFVVDLKGAGATGAAAFKSFVTTLRERYVRGFACPRPSTHTQTHAHTHIHTHTHTHSVLYFSSPTPGTFSS